ncbi:hypothetical protein KAFR_0I01700 [Kazachstania africana CBS 2517]|uniref:Peptidase A1 domain-containing protein n=1 Tax=Kazachstania africana (strain ATCC 22294 / BCRC 22015 / CBS 2517 / CECT 1963 / NBRC 1671 / NRRL Y-8276) TaxID=1071382 RepID=H2B001_KAZAF|nr:hypothetical protein KAFR_0I01700 [Kazachstania africana CBS 2517]CCF59951.1 hypothetical protein KAFR_0I01700 [Kazachstania africana CBS 2517]
MKALNLRAILATSVIASLTSALIVDKNVEQLSSNENKYLKLDFASETFEKSSRLPLQKRDTYATVNISAEFYYVVQLSVGTPGQNVTLLVDTCSSDIWVTSPDNPLCDGDIFYDNVEKTAKHVVVAAAEESTVSDGDSNGLLDGEPVSTTPFESSVIYPAEGLVDCGFFGTFNPNDSSTWSTNHTDFVITYSDNSTAEGVWGQDVLSIGGLDISGVPFAVANYTNSSLGVLGIGLPGSETTYLTNSYMYDNLPMVLKKSGVIDSAAYSLLLAAYNNYTSGLLFGAVDHSKYSGSLYTIPMINIYESRGYESPVEFDVTIYGLGISSTDSNTTIATMKTPALLDSGSTAIFFPTTLLNLAAEQLNATYSEEKGLYTIPYSPANISFVFDFGGFHINLPIRELCSVSYGEPEYILNIVAHNENRIVLGEAFLARAYVVFDFENYEISMGQSSYDYAEEDIEAIISTVPGAVKVASYSNSWSSFGSITSGGDIFTISSNAGKAVVTPTQSTTRSTQSAQSTTSSTSKSNNFGYSGISYGSHLLLASAPFVLTYLL